MSITSQINAVKQAGGVRLNLACDLTEFPVEIYDLADTLEILDLSGNHLSSLPDDFVRLHKLRILFCSNNQFTELPAILGQCAQLSMVGFKANKINHVPGLALGRTLRWLILTDNQISELPAEIGLCTQLQKLMLAGNRLQTLPHEMRFCTQLELLRIPANRFTALPNWLLTLPRLSWLAFAGNPYSEDSEARARSAQTIAEIDWRHLEVNSKLGEGASGVIHRAVWQHAPEKDRDVAVKLFKGRMTSDGLPHSEKTACMSAGMHANLISVHGKISGHPAGTKGLIMSLVDPSFSNLAEPPSLDSCTRDIYPAHAKFTLKSSLRIAQGIASAARHLHSKGIMHGDLYAHNILHNEKGDCLLGDFGAASFFKLEDEPLALALQRIEVRAFGCLLGELIALCEKDNKSNSSLAALKTLQENCTQANNPERPLFDEILNILERLGEKSLTT